MVLKKRHSTNIEEDGSKRRRKDEVCEKSEDKKKSKKGKEYPVKVVEKRLSDDDDEDDDDDPEEENNVDIVSGNPEVNSKEDNYGIGWPQADLIELFNRIEANIPRNDVSSHNTRTENLDWDEIAFNNYSPLDCKTVWTEVVKRIRHFRILSEILADARVWVHQPWTNFYKGSKNAKHPDFPRRPLGTFFLYYQDKKHKVIEQNPELEMTQIPAIVAQMWKALPYNKKQKYEKKAEELKKEFDEKVRIFYEQHPEIKEEDTKRKLATMKKPLLRALPGGFTKPKTPKMLFSEDRLSKLKDDTNLSRAQLMANFRVQWDSLSDKKKLVWIKQAAEEEDKYFENLKLYKIQNPDFEMPKSKSVLTREELNLKDKSVGKPHKPPPSGYALFASVMLSTCPEFKALLPKERLKEISVRWKKLSDKEQEEYKQRLQNEKEQYEVDYAAYLETLPEDERKEELLKTQTLRQAKQSKIVTEAKNGKKAPKANSKKSNEKEKTSVKKVERQYFPGEPHQPPVKAYDLFVESFVSDTKLCATEAPKFWEMLPANDKAKFTRKLGELKEKYIKDYKKFLKSLDEVEVARYNELQKRNKEIATVEAKKEESDADEDSDEDSSSEEEENEKVHDNKKKNAIYNSDSDENNETETKKSDSSSDSSSSSESSSDSSSSDDSDSSSDDSDDEDKNTPQVAAKEEESDSDSSDDD